MGIANSMKKLTREQKEKKVLNGLKKMIREQKLNEAVDFDRNVYQGTMNVLGKYLMTIQQKNGGTLTSTQWNSYIEALKKAIQEAKLQNK